MGDFNYDPMLKTATNKPYRLLVGDALVYSRLTVDGTNFADADDTNPSEEAVSEEAVSEEVTDRDWDRDWTRRRMR